MGASHSQPYEESNQAVLGRRDYGETSEQEANQLTAENSHNEQNLMRSKPQLWRQQKFPHNYEQILKEADSPVDKSSAEKLRHQLYDGVLLNHGRKMYWLNKNSESNCFMLYARALSITWSEEPHYWQWLSQNISSDKSIEVCELVNVCWLEVHGKFETKHLSPGALYEVSFVVMLKDAAYGWDVPVDLRLVLPKGNKQEHNANLLEKPRAKWIEIPVGEFVASENELGEIEFSMFEYHGGQWKKGLVIKGVSIKAKT